MRTYSLLVASLLFTASSLVTGSETDIDQGERRISTSYVADASNTTVPVKKPHPPPKKPPTTDSSSGSSTTASDTASDISSAATTGSSVDNTSAGGSTDNASAASGGSSGGTGGSSSSSAGGSSGTTTTSGGTGSNGSSGTTGSSSSAATTESSAALNPVGPGPAKKSAMLLLGFAAVAGAAIAVVTVPKRKVATPDHPLKGALTRRINMFSHLARHTNDPLARPPRRGDDGSYLNADEIMV